MKISDRLFTAPQLAVMAEHKMSELMMAVFTDLASLWDESGRSGNFKISRKELHELLTDDTTSFSTMSNLLTDMIRLGLLRTWGSEKQQKLSFEPDGVAAAKYILGTKSKTRYARLPLQCGYDGVQGTQRRFSATAWESMLRTFRQSIIKIDAARESSEFIRTVVYIDHRVKEDAITYLHNYVEFKRQGLTNLPPMLKDKIAMFEGREMPSWLQYEIKQHAR